MNPSDVAPIRVVIVDDHALIREGVRALLASVPDMELVGEASSGRQAVTVTAETEPDVVLMDPHMADGDGIDATRRIVASNPGVAVLVVSMLDDDTSVFAAMRAGARGYILKGAEPEELRRAIHGVVNGEAIFGPGVAERVLDLFNTGARAAVVFPQLTEREREILDLLARGLSNPAIARSIHLSPRTVANYVSTILTKLQTTDRTAAALRAREAGLGTAPPD